MALPLRVLNVEDSEDDAELLMVELAEGGYEPIWERVDNAEAMRAALARESWDIVLADYSLPHFSGSMALETLHASGLDLPFIVVSGTIGEERAAEMMRAGAHDIVLKGHLTRLLPVIERELREAEIRRERRRAQEELVVVNRGLRLLSAVNQTLLRVGAEAELLLAVCNIAVELGGYRFAWIGLLADEMPQSVHPVACAGIENCLEMLRCTWKEVDWGHGPPEIAARTGKIVCEHDITASPVSLPWRDTALRRGFRALIALPIIMDAVTIGTLNLFADTAHAFPPEEVKLLSELADDLGYGLLALRTRKALHEREQQYRSIVETAQEGIWVLDRAFNTSYVNQRMAEMLGYQVDEMLGRSMFDFVDVALRGEFEQHIASNQRGVKEIYEFRFRKKDGGDLWVLTSVTPVLDSGGEFTGTFAMLTDITERHMYDEYQREFARKTIEAATEGKLLIRAREEIMRMAGEPLAAWEISRAEDLETVRHAASELAQSNDMEEERIFDFILCISEATTNAVKHAGGGMLSIHRFDASLLAIVSDRGSGIPAINLPDLALKRGYTTAMSLGMGYKAIISMADMVYLSTSPSGTTVAIVMGLKTPAPPVVAAIELPGANW